MSCMAARMAKNGSRSASVSDEYVTSAGITHEIDAQVAYVRLNGLETHVEGRDDINNIHIVEMEVYGEETDNLAYGKPVTSSGTDNSAGSSANSRDTPDLRHSDGNRSTYWDGGVYADEPWICVDLGEIYSLDRMNVITYWARNDRYYYYDLYTSVDGENFTLLYAKDEGTQLSTIHGEDVAVDGTVHARYVRLVGKYDSANASFHLNELRVYGQSDEAWNDARTALEEAIQRIETLDLSQYTEQTAQVLQEQMNAAQVLLADGSISSDELNTALVQLEDAAAALQSRASQAAMDALQTAVDNAAALKDDYSEEDFADVQAAITAAQALLDDPANASSTAVVSAMLDLSQAVSELPEEGASDKLRENLKATIDYINEHILTNVDNVRPGKVQELKTAVAEAYQVYLDADATDEEIQTAIRTLTEKAQELWEIVSKAELNALIETAEAIEADGYTEMSYRALAGSDHGGENRSGQR